MFNYIPSYQPLKFFEHSIGQVFRTKRMPSEINNSFYRIRAVRFPLEGTELVAVVRNELITQYGSDGRSQVEDVVAAVRDHFPTLPLDLIIQAKDYVDRVNGSA